MSQQFVQFLQGLAVREDLGALATLRRGLQGPPGHEPGMYKYVVPWVGEDWPRWREETHYLVAALFASHPVSWPKDNACGQTNLGASFARMADEDAPESVERRFTALLSTRREDLWVQLRHAVSLLKSKDVPIDWDQLLNDLRWWGNEEMSVQRNWAKAFWRQAPGSAAEETNADGASVKA